MIDLTQPCIIAPNKPDHNGYHRVTFNENRFLAHRFAYIMTYGPPPPEKPFILHKCNNPACWNPGHLKAGTHSENMLDSVKAGTQNDARKTHCPRGHELSGDNLVGWFKKRGSRSCRICWNNKNLLRYHAKKLLSKK